MIPIAYHSVLLHVIYMNIVMNAEIQNNNSNINNDDVYVHIIPEISFLLGSKKTEQKKKNWKK